MKYLLLALPFLVSCHREEIYYQVSFKNNGKEWQTFITKPLRPSHKELMRLYCKEEAGRIKKLLSVGYKNTFFDQEACWAKE